VFGKQRIEPSAPGSHQIQGLDSKIIVQQAPYGLLLKIVIGTWGLFLSILTFFSRLGLIRVSVSAAKKCCYQLFPPILSHFCPLTPTSFRPNSLSARRSAGREWNLDRR
jgi:hypothetical protein